jgi:hypothetical protein
MAGIGFLIGGALQGLGQGMAKQAEQNWEERKARALAALKENKLMTVGKDQDVINPETGQVVYAGAGKAPDLPGIGDELVAAGYTPGTPEFKDAMVQVMNGKYATEYTDAQGNVRRRSAVQLQAPNTAPSATGELARPQSQEDYDALPPGARYMKPNGETAVKRGPASAPGGFRNIPSGSPLDPYS